MTVGIWLTLACNINIGRHLGCSLNGGVAVLLSVTKYWGPLDAIEGLYFGIRVKQAIWPNTIGAIDSPESGFHQMEPAVDPSARVAIRGAGSTVGAPATPLDIGPSEFVAVC